ncbi:c-type cytochrome [Roseicyclus sp.]|uniref:c-type cytochrome n=1 Tax=Roseicyclus sp. TaxID=1914329 RepID=UPI003F6C506B
MRALPLALCLCLLGPAVAAQDIDAGAVLYRDFCAACHGPEARGDGTMADLLRTPPSDLTKLGGTGAFPILAVAEQIDGRRPRAAHGGDMPLFGRWFEGVGADVAMAGPDGQPILMSRPVADLIAYLITLQD